MGTSHQISSESRENKPSNPNGEKNLFGFKWSKGKRPDFSSKGRVNPTDGPKLSAVI